MDDRSGQRTLEDLNRAYARLRGYTTIKPWALDLSLAMRELESIQGAGVHWAVDGHQPAVCIIIRERNGGAVEFRKSAETLPAAIMRALVGYFQHLQGPDDGA